MRPLISIGSRFVIGAITGMSLFLLSALIYTRITMYDPYLLLMRGSHLGANALAFVHLVTFLVFWSAALRTIKGPEMILICCAAGFAVTMLASVIIGVGFHDFLGLYLARHVVELTVVLAACVIPLLRLGGESPDTPVWWRWCLLCGVSLSAGVLIYAVTGRKSAVDIFSETILILVLPTMCLSLVAFQYRGHHQLVVRGIATAGAMLGVAVATIH
jgi:hypothetical protein